jgi:hypothetical protein
MAFKMFVSKEAVEGKEVVPAGQYLVRFVKFVPKFSKPNAVDPNKVPSLNYNAQMEIVEGEYAGRILFEGLNQNAGWIQNDFCHCFGFPMEHDPSDDTYAIPGMWDGEEGKAETYVYKGPLTGKVGKVEVAVDSYNNKPNNKIRKYFCAIDNCDQLYPNVKHSQDLLVKRS